MKIASTILASLLTVSAALAAAKTTTMTFDLSAVKTPIEAQQGILVVDGKFLDVEEQSNLPANFSGCAIGNDNGGLEEAQKSPLTLTVTGERMGMYLLAKDGSTSGIVTVQCIKSVNRVMTPIDALTEIETISKGAIKIQSK